MEQKLPSILLTAILATLLLGLTWRDANHTSPPEPVSTTNDQGALDALASRIDRLATRIEVLERTRSGTTVVPDATVAQDAKVAPGPTGLRRPVEDLDAKLAPLQNQINKLWQALATNGMASLRNDHVDLDVLRRTTPNYEALKIWFELRGKDEARARQELILMSQEDVVRRFGRPHGISAGEAGARVWYYCSQDENDGVSITFLDGHVVDC